MDSDFDRVSRHWHDFLQVRSCPFCGNDEWTAEAKGWGTARARWVYYCGDRSDCQGCWGPPKFIESINSTYRVKWRLPVNHRNKRDDDK